jgi:hypothetical protein
MQSLNKVKRSTKKNSYVIPFDEPSTHLQNQQHQHRNRFTSISSIVPVSFENSEPLQHQNQ